MSLVEISEGGLPLALRSVISFWSAIFGTFRLFGGLSKQLFNRLRAVIHQRERASARAGQFRGQI